MGKLNTIFMFARRHKYWITVLLFASIIGFVGDNSLIHRIQHKHTISILNDEIDKYQKMFNDNQTKLKQLATNPEAIEKVARERYFMKKENEDIFIFEKKDGTLDDLSIENKND